MVSESHYSHMKIICIVLCSTQHILTVPSKSTTNIAHQFKVKHLWVKKATGLGVTEFILRFMAWLCLCNDDYRNSQMVIVTGPNQELAIKLIKRLKALFEPARNNI